jgi:hypothetical protein
VRKRRVTLNAVIRPEGAGWVIELVGEDSPVDRYFVREIKFQVEEKVGREKDRSLVRPTCPVSYTPYPCMGVYPRF